MRVGFGILNFPGKVNVITKKNYTTQLAIEQATPGLQHQCS